MHEILRHLPEGARVLDLGRRTGSFDASLYAVRTVRLDLAIPVRGGAVDFVQADASAMPFANISLDAVVANHSLEHFEKLELTPKEMGRLVKPGGAIFVAVRCMDGLCFSVITKNPSMKNAGQMCAFAAGRAAVPRGLSLAA